MINPDSEQSFADQYRTHGTFGNNTTIPSDEKARIASLPAETPSQLGGRARFAGEQAMHEFCMEWGLVPTGHIWTDFENIGLSPLVPRWQRPFNDQYITNPGKLSKTPRKMEEIIRRKQGGIK